MFTVYILENSETGKHYIGYTEDLERRLSEHNRGQTKSTKSTGMWKIIHKETYNTLVEARQREKLIKSYKGGNGFRKLIAGVVQW